MLWYCLLACVCVCRCCNRAFWLVCVCGFCYFTFYLVHFCEDLAKSLVNLFVCAWMLQQGMYKQAWPVNVHTVGCTHNCSQVHTSMYTWAQSRLHVNAYVSMIMPTRVCTNKCNHTHMPIHIGIFMSSHICKNVLSCPRVCVHNYNFSHKCVYTWVQSCLHVHVHIH